MTAMSGRKTPRARVELGHVAIEDHLDDLDHGGDRADVGQEAEKGEIVLRQVGADPGQRALLEQVVVDQVVHRHRDAENKDHRRAEPDGGLDLARDGEERAHAEKEGQGHVLDEDGLDSEIQIVLEHLNLPRSDRASRPGEPRSRVRS